MLDIIIHEKSEPPSTDVQTGVQLLQLYIVHPLFIPTTFYQLIMLGGVPKAGENTGGAFGFFVMCSRQ